MTIQEYEQEDPSMTDLLYLCAYLLHKLKAEGR